MIKIFAVIIFLTSVSLPSIVRAERHYGTVADSLSSAPDGAICRSYVDLPLVEGLAIPIPSAAVFGMMQYGYDLSLRQSADRYLPGFKNGYDDYAQFAPLAATWGLRAFGIEGRSRTIGEAFVAQATSMLLVTMAVHIGKQSIGRLRPDGTAYNSFPSGHTATAFACAAILDAEYGKKYPWLSLGGYGVAVITGIGRILNNRHWGADVIVGASVGTTFTYLGYRLSDLIFGRKRTISSFDRYEGDGSPLLFSIDNTRSSLLSPYANLLLTLSARIPVHDRWGAVARGSIISGKTGHTDEWLNATTLLGGVSYMYPLWGGRVWLDAEASAGYLSRSDRRVQDAGGANSYSESTPFATSSPLFRVGGSAMVMTNNTFGLRLNAALLHAPAVKPLQEDSRVSRFGYEIGLSVSYLLNIK